MNTFIKSHALGNSYIVLDQSNIDFELTPDRIQKLCSVETGIGSDGILLKVPSSKAEFGVRIFNPDGSEAEKSGNGLRIFGKFLYDYGFSNRDSFAIETPGGIVDIDILEKRKNKVWLLKAAMGQAEFNPRLIPVVLNGNTVLNHHIRLSNDDFRINCVSIGNPHCIIFQEELDEAKLRKYGPLLEKHPLFPSRINVQFARIRSKNEVDILIWERGAGYTTASGSSSCAVAAVGRKLGLLDQSVLLNMPGGQLSVEMTDDWQVYLTGPVEEICQGKLNGFFFTKNDLVK
jgi:diaminopimelate epimerase